MKIAHRDNVQIVDLKKGTVTVIADRLKISLVQSELLGATSSLAKVGLLLCFVIISTVSGQQSNKFGDLDLAQLEFDNGNYLKALEIVEVAGKMNMYSSDNRMLFRYLDLKASSQISLKKFSDAEITLEAALKLSTSDQLNYQKALIYMRFASLFRSQREFSKALSYSSLAIATVPNDRSIRAQHFLNIGRILFSSGQDISSIVWLEKAEELLDAGNISEAKLDTYRFLTLASSLRLNYQAALNYAEKSVAAAKNSRFKNKYRMALFELAKLLSSTGQRQKAFETLKKGAEVSLEQNDLLQARNFQTSLVLESLYVHDIVNAEKYLDQLETTDLNRQFSYEIKLGKAVISAYKNQNEKSEKLLSELEKTENYSKFILPYWKISIAEHKHDWEELISINKKLLDLSSNAGFTEDLPGIYLNFAKAYFHRNQFKESLENAKKSLALIEQIQETENKHLSLGLSETFHSAYRLLAQTKSNDPQESFELSDFLKARILKDRINDSVLRAKKTISPTVRQKLEDLSLKYIDDDTLEQEVDKYEKLASNSVPELNIKRPDLSNLESTPEIRDSAIVSYFFTFDKKLIAFVWEKGKSLKKVELPISEDEVDDYARRTHQNIKNLIFFKKDGKELFDKLLKPLSLTSKHWIIIPDKSIWKIPFQALSPDGEKYLIEERLISYAPSVSILVEQLKNPPPNRRTLQAFANSTYENQLLKNVNTEAIAVAGIFGSKPVLNASIGEFKKLSQSADIFHFSMHAQIENDLPLQSFLAFKKIGSDDGRLTVEDFLEIKVKKQSLVFLASCDTNTVLNGEGLVSLAWAIMGSGATTVISAQWEANDKSTEMFTRTFYKYYKQGSSSAEAMQKASIDLIRNKSYNFHEPYYWADFTLTGDFR